MLRCSSFSLQKVHPIRSYRAAVSLFEETEMKLKCGQIKSLLCQTKEDVQKTNLHVLSCVKFWSGFSEFLLRTLCLNSSLYAQHVGLWH